MVNFNEMMRQRASSMRAVGVDTARRAFEERAFVPGNDPDMGRPALDRDAFVELLADLVGQADRDTQNDPFNMINDILNARRFKSPSKRDLHAAFRLADMNENGFIELEEFIAIFTLAVEGKVLGLDAGIAYYCPPRQLRRWDEHEPHPETDWQDLFFDLLFVGGAYQSGNLMAYSMVTGQAWKAFPWFAVIFMTLAQQWFMKLYLQSRFSFVSFFHGILSDTLEFTFMAFAIWNVPGLKMNVDVTITGDHDFEVAHDDHAHAHRHLSDLGHLMAEDHVTADDFYFYGDVEEEHTGSNEKSISVQFTPLDQLIYNVDDHTYGFSLFICLNSVLYLLKWCEVLYMPEATPGALFLSKYMILWYAVISTVFASAAIVARKSTDDKYYTNEGSADCLYIWATGVALFVSFFMAWVTFLNRKEDVREYEVPMSVNYIIHRLGEWAMLMMGETVLSLIVAPRDDDRKNYVIFGSGMFIVTNLCFQHYAMYPTNPSKHVMRRGRLTYGSFLYLFIMLFVYSAALVMVGVGCKVEMKQASTGEVQNEANWILSNGLAISFVCITVFSGLHQKNIFKGLVDTGGGKDIGLGVWGGLFLRVTTTASYYAVAAVEFKPAGAMVNRASYKEI